MKANLETRPKRSDCKSQLDFHLRMAEWFEGFADRQETIRINPQVWLDENMEGLMSRFGLHSTSGFKPTELLVYFIEKEILGE